MANATSCLEISTDAYCTLSAVNAYIPRRAFSDSSVPTRRQVISMCKDIYQEVNGLLDSLGYHISVASTNGTSIRILGRLNALGGAAAAEAAAYSAGNPTRSEHAEYLREEYRALYTKLEKGLLTLPAAVREADYTPTRREQTVDAEFDQPSGTELAGTFTKGMNF